MKVFKFTWEDCMYGGGIALVAANTKSDAQLLLISGWEFDSLVEDLSATGEPRVLASYTYVE